MAAMVRRVTPMRSLTGGPRLAAPPLPFTAWLASLVVSGWPVPPDEGDRELHEDREPEASAADRSTPRRAGRDAMSAVRRILEGWSQDLTYAVRSLRGTPRPTLAAMACVALGIASAAFIFSLADAVLIRPLPFADAPRLQRVWTVDEASGRTGDLSYPDIVDLREAVRSFDRWEVAARTRVALGVGGETERVRGESVTPGYFDLVGVGPALGRLFAPAEYARGAPGVMVISDALWKRSFGGSPDVVGRSVLGRGDSGTEGDRAYEIVGVMAPGFAGTVEDDVSEFWLPLEQYAPRALLEQRTARMAWVMARLRPGATAAGATAEVAEVGRRLAARHPEAYHGLRMGVEPVGEYWKRRFRPGLVALGAAAALLLVISCLDIANLLMARQVGRESELALRAALGAGRARVVRQVLVEGLVIAGAGGAVGVALAWWGEALLADAHLLDVPAYVTLAPNGRLLAFALAAVVATALLFGALPAVLATRVDPARYLRDGGRSSNGRGRHALGDALVVLEVSLTFPLLAASVLLLRSYGNLLHADPGFRTESLARLAISLDPAGFPDAGARLGFVGDARLALKSTPGVLGVTFVAGVLPPWFDPEVSLAVDGTPAPALTRVERHATDEAFADVMDIRLLSGRFIDDGDQPDGMRVAVVSESVARAVSGDDPRAALRHTIQPVVNAGTGQLGPPLRIVGVVEDVRYHGPLGERPRQLDMYVPLVQEPGSVLSVAVHTNGDAARRLTSLRHTLADLAPTSPLHWISTMDEELAAQFARSRFYAWVTGAYGVCALALALLGVYGLLTHAVERRAREIGIRMALGADGGAVLRLVLARGVGTVSVGLLGGTGLALAGRAVLSTLVYGVGTSDPPMLGGAAGAFLLLAVISCWVPARRASRLDPTPLMRAGGGPSSPKMWQ
jgi:putative ABC transport system permease protein